MKAEMSDAYAVFGNPIGHSKSPLIHQAFAAQTGQDLTYEAILAPVDDFAGALDAFIASHWKAHMEGIFGVCVRSPGNIAAIANKETSQVLLGRLTDSGTRRQYSASEAAVLHGLIARYAEACAPFSPVEYPRTSRKRYVEDLPKQLAG